MRLFIAIVIAVLSTFISFWICIVKVGADDGSFVFSSAVASSFGLATASLVLFLSGIHRRATKSRPMRSGIDDREDLRAVYGGKTRLPASNESFSSKDVQPGQPLTLKCLRQNVHALVFFVLVAIVLRLQWAGKYIGWPLDNGGMDWLIDALLGIILIGSSMLPFRYDAINQFGFKNVFAWGSIASVVAAILAKHPTNNSLFEQFLVVIILTMSGYGIWACVLNTLGRFYCLSIKNKK